jgi:hypothetical protein
LLLVAALAGLALLAWPTGQAPLQAYMGRHDVAAPGAVALLPLVIGAPPGVPALTPTSTATSTPTSTATSTSTSTPTSTPTSTAQLPEPTFNDCRADPHPGAAPNYPLRITAIAKLAETVTLQNVSAAGIDLSGWHMCSITGNQHHPIGGSLSPGQSYTFLGPQGFIWNNAERDDGALYSPDGRLVSYWVDL